MLVRRVAFAAFTASALLSSALVGPSFATVTRPGGGGLNSKDHTPVLERCAAYESEFKRAAADQPPSHKLVEAQRLNLQGVRSCDMNETRATQGANDIAEALQLIGAHPGL